MPAAILAPPRETSGKVDKDRLSARFVLPGHELTLLLLACLALFFFRLGCWGFIDPGDGYFSEASREMIESGDYLTPHLNYQIYFSKPILIYWLISSAYNAFGINELSARLWSALLATALVLACYQVVRRLSGRRAGLLAGLILASSPLVLTFARMSLIDMTFSSLLGIALCCTVMTVVAGGRYSWAGIYIALALAVLAKGPAAIALFAIGMAGYFIVSRPGKTRLLSILRSLKAHLGIPLFLAIALPWYIAVGLATKGLFLKVFFLFENLGRFAGHTNHRIPYWWFYLPVLAYGFFPWVLFAPAALAGAFRKPGQGASGSVSGQQQAAPGSYSAMETNAGIMLACWTLGILLFFSASQTKLQTYILPAFPSLAMLVGICLDKWIKQSEHGFAAPRCLRIASSGLLFFGALALILSPAVAALLFNPHLPSLISHSHLSERLGNTLSLIPLWIKATVAILLPILGLGFIKQNLACKSGNIGSCVFWLTGTTVITCALSAPIAFELGYNFRQADLHQAIRVLKGRTGPVAFFQEFKPSVIFSLRRPVDTFFSPDQLLPVTSSERPGTKQYIIAGGSGCDYLLKCHGDKLQLIARNGSWSVFETSELVAQRLPTLEQTFSQDLKLSTDEFSWGTLPFAGGSKPWAQGH